MINILPERGRSEVRRIYLLRLSSLALCAAAVALLIMAAFLLSGYLESLAAEKAARTEASAIEDESEESRALEAPIMAAREQLEAYEPLIESEPIRNAVLAAVDAKDAGVALSLITYDRATRTLRVSGMAATRESLLSFERTLRSTPQVEEVLLPVSDLARSTNAPFSVTLRFKEQTP